MEKLLPTQHSGSKAHPTLGNPNTQFCYSGQDLLLDLSRHAGLAGTREAGGMGVGVGGKSAVDTGCFVEADARSNVIVGSAQSCQRVRVAVRLLRLLYGLHNG